MTGWSWFWIAWLAAFLIADIWAATNKKPGDTLSEHAYKWFSLRGKGKLFQLRRLAMALILVYLVGHFMSGGALW